MYPHRRQKTRIFGRLQLHFNSASAGENDVDFGEILSPGLGVENGEISFADSSILTAIVVAVDVEKFVCEELNPNFSIFNIPPKFVSIFDDESKPKP